MSICIDLTADIVSYDDVSLQALIKWNSTNLLGLYFEPGEFNMVRILRFNGMFIMIFLDHKLDVRLEPVPNEHCSINPCVAFGLKSVRILSHAFSSFAHKIINIYGQNENGSAFDDDLLK